MPDIESSNDKFVRLGTARGPKAINAIRLVGNLSAYDGTPAQKAYVIEQLRNAVDEVETKFFGGAVASAFALPVQLPGVTE